MIILGAGDGIVTLGVAGDGIVILGAGVTILFGFPKVALLC